MEFYKSLARYYKGWHQDCLDSAEYCRKIGDNDAASKYLSDARKYLNILTDNREAIEFFSIGDNAFKWDSAIPEKFRGYK